MRLRELLTEKMIKHDWITLAINPSLAEWRANFPNGAAGVVVTDGNLIVGDGEALDHLTLMHEVGYDDSSEKYRLQVFTDKLMVELWDEMDSLFDEWDENDVKDIPDELIEKHTLFKKEKRAAIAADLHANPNVIRLRLPIVIALRNGTGVDRVDDCVWLYDRY